MPGNTNQLRLVVAPASDHAEGIDLIGLIEYIEDRSGISIDIKLCSSYKEAIDKLSGGAAELGWLGPYAYMDAVREGAPIEAFAALPPRLSKLARSTMPSAGQGALPQGVAVSRILSPYRRYLPGFDLALADRLAAAFGIWPFPAPGYFVAED